MKLSAAILGLAATTLPAATVVMTDLVPYRSVKDSPFYAQHLAGHAYLEDFEDIDDEASEGMVLKDGKHEFTPNPSFGGGGYNTSVDGDDGVLDRRALKGIGWGGQGAFRPDYMVFEPVPRALTGEYPIWIGFVITYCNRPNLPDRTNIQLLGADDQLLADIDLSSVEVAIKSLPLDPVPFGPVGNDRFIGFVSDTPIKTIRLSQQNAIIIDHFQFGYVPEPGGVVLTGGAILALAMRRRR